LLEYLLHHKNEDGKNSKLHIPRFISSIESRYSHLSLAVTKNDEKSIMLLLDYYTNNANENVGWMLTVTDTLTDIDKNYPKIIKNLFSSRIFGDKKIDFNIESRNINQSPFGYVTYADVRPKLKSWNKKRKCDYNDKSSYKHVDTLIVENVVPIPNLLYITKNHDIEGPFVELLLKSNNFEIFNNPSMEAVLDVMFNYYSISLFVWHIVSHLALLIYYFFFRTII